MVMCFTIFGSTVAQAAEIETPSTSVAASTEDQQVTQLAVQPRSKIGNTYGGILAYGMPYVATLYVDKDYDSIECVYTTALRGGSGTATYKLQFSGPTNPKTYIVANGKSDIVNVSGLKKGTYTITISHYDGSTSARYAFGLDFYG